MSKNSHLGVVILAAGLGKRMKSPLPKVLHEILGEPMIIHLLRKTFRALPECEVAIVVGHGREQVESTIRQHAEFSALCSQQKIIFVTQKQQRGTGDAARTAMDSVWGQRQIQKKSNILVLPGDSPLFTESLLQKMGEPFDSKNKNCVVRLLTCLVQDSTGYGRVVRKGKTEIAKIVEEKDATPKEKQIREIAVSTYLFDSKFLANALPRLKTQNAQGEYYLTDVLAMPAKIKKKSEILCWENEADVKGVNDLWELSQAEALLQKRVVEFWAREGVRFIAPESVTIETSVKLSSGVKIERGVVLKGKTEISPHVEIRTGSVIQDSVVEEGSMIGPYAHLRPESHVGRESKIGNYVELKKTKIGNKTSVAHLSYLGDATVGDRVNIGCGFITCNFDGRVKNGSRKHPTIIEDDVFMGSDCQTIAPVKIGRGAYVASGSTITKDVESDSLAIARTKQEIKPGYAKRLRGQS